MERASPRTGRAPRQAPSDATSGRETRRAPPRCTQSTTRIPPATTSVRQREDRIVADNRVVKGEGTVGKRKKVVLHEVCQIR